MSAFFAAATALAQAAAEPTLNPISLAALALGALALLIAAWAALRSERLAGRLACAEQALQAAREQAAAPQQPAQAAQPSGDALQQGLAGVETALAQQREAAARAALALTLLPQGERQYRLKDLSGALDTYQQALALNEANPLLHYRLGYIHTQRAEFDQAEAHLARALALAPDFSPATAALGYLYRRRAEAASAGPEREKLRFAAEEKLHAALKRSPRLLDEDGESWWGALGGLYRSAGQKRKAMRAYQQAAAITPYSSYPLGNLALLRGKPGDLDAMLDTFREVERLARAEVQAAPDDYWPYADLLLARLALGKIQEAEETLNIMRRLMPPDMPHAAASLVGSLTALAELLPDSAATIADVIAHVQAGPTQAAASVALANQTFVVTLDDLPALAVRVSDQDDPAHIVQLLDLAAPRPAIFLLGGAVDMSADEVAATRPVLEKGLAAYAQARGIAVVDGGTRSGAMQMMGEARRSGRGTFPLVGVAPINLVRFSGHEPPEGYPLDPNHSHFVLTSEGDWGDETDFMVQIAQAIAGGQHPVVGIIINGGGIVRQEVYRLTLIERLQTPLLVLDGSGRFADTLARAIRTGEADDSQLREIISKGRIEVIAIADGADGIRQRLSAYFEPQPQQ